MDLLLQLAAKCLPCAPDLSSPALTVNGTKYRILKLLGEGGFSYVYLVAPKGKALQYAMKKIRCPYGPNDATYTGALREVQNYHRFAAAQSPFIIKIIDEAVVTDPSGGCTFYVLLPYFERSLQDVLAGHVLQGTRMPEEEVLQIFIGVLRGIQVMHNYWGDAADEQNQETESEPMLNGTGDDESGFGATEMGELTPYAHRDIKPANVMLSPEGMPVLVDFGLCTKARVHVKSRQQALTLTDFALEHCTLPYRAPELLDVATNCTITEKTDIWSLGCLLYACCFGFSPFEKLEIEQGANLNVAIAQAKYDVPEGYSPELVAVILSCLKLDPAERPSVDELLEKCLLLLH